MFKDLFGSRKKDADDLRLREELHKFQTLVNVTNENIFVCDASEENILYWMNDTARKSLQEMKKNLKDELNIDVDSIMGGSIHRYHKDPERIKRILEEMARTNNTHRMDIPLGRYTLQTNVHVLRSTSGEVVGYAACWKDVTAERSLKDKIRQEEKAAARISSAVEELTASVHHNADSAKTAKELATEASRVAASGGEVAEELVRAMAEINKSSQRISDITTVIDEIAFQTNLLALNAAIEAARAGELGKGFAVVAAEVRNLAHRSSQAAKEITALIKDSVSKTEEGNRMAEKTGGTLGEIVESVKKVADLISEISASSAEQATGIDEVNRSILQLTSTIATDSHKPAGAGGKTGMQTASTGNLALAHREEFVEI